MASPFIASPSIITNPIPPSVTQKLREAFNDEGCLIAIYRADKDGTVHQHIHRRKFTGSHHLTAYKLFAGDLLKIDTPEEIGEACAQIPEVEHVKAGE